MKKSSLFILSLIAINFFASFVFAASTDDTLVSKTVLTRDLTLPQYMDSFIHGLFNLPADYALTLQSAIILGVLFAVVFFVVSNAIVLNPFFQNKIIGFVASLIITLLTAVSGGLKVSLDWFMSFNNLFDNMGAWKGVGLVIIMVLLIVIAIVLKIVLGGIGKLMSKEEAESAGFNLGKKIAESKIYTKIAKNSMED